MALCEPNPHASIPDLLQVKSQFSPSQHLLISCGCVPVDPQARKIAILRSPYKDDDDDDDDENGGHIKSLVQLPKGRKNIGEDLLDAALRETYEETGIRFEAMPLKIATRATPVAKVSSTIDKADSSNEPFQHPAKMVEEHTADDISSNPDITSNTPNCEPLAVCSYPCLYTGAFKIVFWFAAQADSRTVPEQGTQEAWEEDMKLEWVDAREAAGMMTFEMDGMVVEKALEDMRRSGYEI